MRAEQVMLRGHTAKESVGRCRHGTPTIGLPINSEVSEATHGLNTIEGHDTAQLLACLMMLPRLMCKQPTLTPCDTRTTSSAGTQLLHYGPSTQATYQDCAVTNALARGLRQWPNAR